MNRTAILFFVLGILTTGCSPKYYKTKRQKVNIRKTERLEDRKRRSESKGIRERESGRNAEVLIATSAVKVTPDLIREYIHTYKDIAIVEMQRYKIPASITLAQAILESGSGQGRLARNAHNHFGIKCHKTWEGESVFHDDDEKDECFRKYEYPEQSFEDHSQFLLNRSRYKFLFDYDVVDYEKWAHGLKKAGYATDPNYPSKLIRIIERYNLHQYDLAALGLAAGVSRGATDDLHLVQVGETLYSISKKYGVTVEFLMQLNKLTDFNIRVGQGLKVQ